MVIFEKKIVKIEQLKCENFSYYSSVKFDHFTFTVKTNPETITSLCASHTIFSLAFYLPIGTVNKLRYFLIGRGGRSTEKSP